MSLSVIRKYSIGVSRFEYSLYRDKQPITRIYTDKEGRFAVVNLPSMSMEIRRDASDLSQSEIEDKDTHILTIINE